MALKRLYTIFVLLNLLTVKVLSQMKTPWVLPQHQMTAQLGVGSTFDIAYDNQGFLSTSVYGLNYTYNFSRRWYAQAGWQITQGDYEMGQTVYSLGKSEFMPLAASKETPVLLPLIAINGDRNTLLSDIRNAPIVKLTSPNALYERHQFSLNIGYMKVLPRNVLRIGLGIFQAQTRGRTLETAVYSSDLNVFSTNLQHLIIRKERDFGYNGTVSYDFFLTQKWSIGLVLSASANKNYGPFSFQSALTIGYAPFKNHYKKSALKPQA